MDELRSCERCGATLSADAVDCASCGSLDAPTRDYTLDGGTPEETAELAGQALLLEPGQLLDGRYLVQGPLGAGGMGEVYRVRDQVLGRDVALKLLLPRARSEEGLTRERRRLLDEARTVAQLNHPGIVTVYDAVDHDQGAYIVMELVEGPTLATLLKRRGAFDWRRALPILRQVAQGLAYAHQQGVVHRDIKPSNIMLTREGRAKIMDFGLAQPVELPSDGDRRRVLGTPRYMSPEQLRREPVDGRSDIFSLGIVAYMLLSGEYPFASADDSAAAVRGILQQQAAPLTRLVGELPAELARLVERMLEKEPERRTRSAGDLVRALRSLEEPVGGRRLDPRLLMVGSVLLALLLAAGGLLWSHARERRLDRERELGRLATKAVAAGQITTPAEASAVLFTSQLMAEFPASPVTAAASSGTARALLENAEGSIEGNQPRSAQALLSEALRFLDSRKAAAAAGRLTDETAPEPPSLEQRWARLVAEARRLEQEAPQEADRRRIQQLGVAGERLLLVETPDAEALELVIAELRELAPDGSAADALQERGAERLQLRAAEAEIAGELERAERFYLATLRLDPDASSPRRGLERVRELLEEATRAEARAPSASTPTPVATPLTTPEPTPAPTPSQTPAQQPEWSHPQLPADRPWPTVVVLPQSKTRMRLVPAGSFVLGSRAGARDERPEREVWLSGFYIDEHEVTNVEFERYDAGHRRRRSPLSSCDRCPVVDINYYDARQFAASVGKRLPTEAEWEKAARGGLVGQPYPWGDADPDGRSNWRGSEAVPVASYPANAYGLYDMAGNVAEWCLDYYSPESYQQLEADAASGMIVDPWGESIGERRVIRGGSFALAALPERRARRELRLSRRSHEAPAARNYHVGMRLVWSPRDTSSVRESALASPFEGRDERLDQASREGP